MTDSFQLPHGIIAPPAEEHFLTLWAISAGLILFCILTPLIFKRIRRGNRHMRAQPLSPFKLAVLKELSQIFQKSHSEYLSTEQAYAIWRLLRRIGIHYFGEQMASASANEFAKHCFDKTSVDSVSEYRRAILAINSALYDPKVKISSETLQPLLMNWIKDDDALSFRQVTKI